MVYRPSDIKHLELMNNLQDKTPNASEIIKEVSASAPELLDNVMLLCAKLRASGFDTYAENLEKNTLFYKAAKANDLYSSNETGEQLIDFAHPEGDTHISDATEENGNVETIISQHKKMVDIVNREPKKLASYIEQCKVVLSQVAGGMHFKELDFPTPKGGSIFQSLIDTVGSAWEADAAVAAGTSAAAIGAAAILGGIAGNILFNHYLAPDELQSAGEKLSEKGESMKDNMDATAKKRLIDFQVLFQKILKQYPIIAQVKEYKEPNDLAAMSKLNDMIWQSKTYAQTLWSWGQSYKDDHVMEKLPYFNQHTSDLVALAANYMKVASDINSLMEKFASDAQEKLQEAARAQSASTGGEATANLMNAYKTAMQNIVKYEAVIKAKRYANAGKLNVWLDSIKEYIKSEASDFNSVEVSNKATVAPEYMQRLDQVNERLNAFKAKWAPNA